MKKIELFFNKINKILEYILWIIMILLVLNVFIDVVLKSFFNMTSIGFQELQWHFFSVIMLLGLSYGLLEESHVRVDIFFDNFKPKTKALINFLGVFIFILPIAFLVAFSSIDFAKEAFISNEMSPDPGGLPYRWIIKSVISFSFFLLIFMSFGYAIRNLNILLDKNYHEDKKAVRGKL